MSFLKFAVFLLSAVIALTTTVCAATFTDDMALAQNTAETQYLGLRPYSENTFGLSDQSLLTFANTAAPLSGAIYRVNGAETITVGIYTFTGTCIQQSGNGLLLGPGTVQAKKSKSGNEIFSDFNGGAWRLVLNSATIPVFEPADSLPGDLVGYGLNIYASADGGNFGSPLSAYVTRSAPETLYYEEYTAFIPASAKYIKVEINDVTSFSLVDGGALMNPRYICLALAVISGEALVMGEPEKSVQQPYIITSAPADGEDEQPVEEEEAPSVNTMPKIGMFEADEDVPEEKSSSSKFEGTITASSKAQKKASSKEDTQVSEASSQKIESSVSSSSEPEPPREEIYEIRREKSGGLLDSGVTVYIIAAAVALGLLLIFGKGPNSK